MLNSPLKPSAIFLDRDGTLNKDTGYPTTLDDIILIDGAIEAVRMFNEQNLPVVVVTNQSGVARGYFSETDVQELNSGYGQLFKQAGAHIDAFFYCPHHVDGVVEQYAILCECRKPGTKLFADAQQKLGLGALGDAIMIGDKYSDIQAGKNLGMTTVLVKTGEGAAQYARNSNDPDMAEPTIVVENILLAAEWIVGNLL